MTLILYINEKEWFEIPVRNKSSIPWQISQLKRDYSKEIEYANGNWKIILASESKMNKTH